MVRNLFGALAVASVVLASSAFADTSMTYTGQDVLAVPGDNCGKITVGGNLVGVQWADGFVAQGLWAAMLQLEGQNVVVTTQGVLQVCQGAGGVGSAVPKVTSIGRAGYPN